MTLAPPRAALALTAAVLLAAGSAAATERTQVPEKYRWNLADLYPTPQAWEQARDGLRKAIPELARFRGRLGASAKELADGLDALFGLEEQLSRLGTYAMALSDEDTRAAGPRAMKQAADQLGVDLGAAASYFRPEILALAPERVRAYEAEEPRLAPYHHYLDDALRWRPHTLSPSEEQLVARAGALEGTGGDVFTVLTDAEVPYPEVTLSTGKKVRMDPAAYTLHRASPVRADRDLAFQSYLGTLSTYRGTLGTTLYSKARADVFEKDAHRFGSSLEAALFTDAIPAGVYSQLLADVHKNLPTLHRYLALRRRVLGLKELRYQDLYVPIVPKVDLHFSPDQARAITLEALAPLGPEYQAVLKKGFESRWTDYLPTTGKRSGAYSTGVYGVHPYQLLNFNGQYLDLSTLAHESGHSMHTWLSMTHQPFATSDYATFVAEVASTLNENLLVHHLLDQAKDDTTRLALLGSWLDTLRQTLFRQAQFAEFELAFHEKAEKGEDLTGETLSKLYLDITRAYYGHAQGVCRVDDLISIEWAMIPHFYRGFYVYQYATSIVASTALARAIREEAAHGGTEHRDAYLHMLSSGSSKYPLELLRDAGVDMTTSRPFDAAMAEMNAIMDEMERILAKQRAR